jgi:hypothetical protein
MGVGGVLAAGNRSGLRDLGLRSLLAFGAQGGLRLLGPRFSVMRVIWVTCAPI